MIRCRSDSTAKAEEEEEEGDGERGACLVEEEREPRVRGVAPAPWLELPQRVPQKSAGIQAEASAKGSRQVAGSSCWLSRRGMIGEGLVWRGSVTKTTDIVDAVTTTMGGEQPHACAAGAPILDNITHVEPIRSRIEAMPPPSPHT